MSSDKPKRYRLLKDLPRVKSPQDVEWDSFRQQYVTRMIDKRCHWFELIPEEIKEPSPNGRLYTQEYLDEQIEKAFNAARKLPLKPGGIVSGYEPSSFQFQTFEDYKQSINTSSQKYKSIYDGAGSSMFTHDEPGQYVTENPRTTFEKNKKFVVQSQSAEQLPDSKDRGWEIKTYRNKSSDAIFEIASVWNNTIYREGFKEGTGEFLKQDCFEINSVCRTSDNSIWTVGEEVLGIEGRKEKIVAFELSATSRNMEVQFSKESISYNWLYQIQKLPAPQPQTNNLLYKTEDNWFVYDKDTYPTYKVDKGFQILQFSACDSNGDGEGAKYFHSKDKAQEYVLMNKPCLSVNDFKKIERDTRTWEDHDKELIALAKSKINQ